MISKKYIVFLFCWLLGGICYASFPVESETIINNIDNANPKFDFLAFLIGVFSAWTLPYSLLVLFLIKRKHIRKSLIYGWLVGILIIAALLLLLFIGAFTGVPWTIY